MRKLFFFSIIYINHLYKVIRGFEQIIFGRVARIIYIQDYLLREKGENFLKKKINL